MQETGGGGGAGREQRGALVDFFPAPTYRASGAQSDTGISPDSGLSIARAPSSGG